MKHGKKTMPDAAFRALAVDANLRQGNQPEQQPDSSLTVASPAALLPAIVAGLPETAELIDVRSAQAVFA